MRRSLRMLAALAFLTGALAPVLIAVTPGTASATTCVAGSDCTLTGTLSLAAGTLSLTSPSSLSWGTTLTGFNLSLVDTSDEQYMVDDATGSGSGWHVAMSATTFTTGTQSLADAGTLSTNGSVISATATAGPSEICEATCTVPANTTTYPVAITTAASSPTPSTIFDTVAGTGLGDVLIGGSTDPGPVGWWLQIPADVYAGTYTSSVTLEVISGP